MVHEVSLLVMLVQLVDRVPLPAPPAKPGRGRPATYTERLFLKALVIMLIRHLPTPYERWINYSTQRAMAHFVREALNELTHVTVGQGQPAR